MVYFFHLSTASVSTKISRQFFQYNKADQTELVATLSSVSWDTYLSPDLDIDVCWDNFKDLLFAAISDVVPVAKQKGKRRRPWITHDHLLV